MKTNHPGFRLSEYDRVRVTCDPVGESLTKQSFANDCDINVIMGRVEKSGTYPMVQGQPFFGDFSDGMSYHDAMNRVLEAQGMFMQLPASLRAQFDNDPGKFLDFVIDPANGEKLVEMGLAQKAEPVAPVVSAPPVTTSDKPPEGTPKA